MTTLADGSVALIARATAVGPVTIDTFAAGKRSHAADISEVGEVLTLTINGFR